MARINGLIPLFGAAQVRNYLDGQIEEYERRVLEGLKYMGEEFVNAARNTRTYTDRTGNLRSSVGYLILKNGQPYDRYFTTASGRGTAGPSAAEDTAMEVASQYPSGLVLIGVAGMKYAAYVEARGYDVITGSAPKEGDVEGFFKSLLDEK